MGDDVAIDIFPAQEGTSFYATLTDPTAAGGSGLKRPWPEWAELVPGVIWIYDFTHFRASRRCAVAVLDVVSRYWLATVVSPEESSTQVELAFTRALLADGKEHLLDEELLEHLSHGVVPDDDERVPVLLAVSDNGPQMTSRATAVFMAGARIAQHLSLIHISEPTRPY